MSTTNVTVDDKDPRIVYSCLLPELDDDDDDKPSNSTKGNSTTSASSASASPSTALNTTRPTGWEKVDVKDALEGSEARSRNASCNATLEFEGSGIQVLGTIGADMGPYTCSLDNETYIRSFSARSRDPKSKAIYCQIQGLKNKNHTFTLTSGPLPNFTTALDSMVYFTGPSNGNSTFFSENALYDMPPPTSALDPVVEHFMLHKGPLILLVTLIIIAVVEVGFLILAGLIKLSAPVKIASSRGRQGYKKAKKEESGGSESDATTAVSSKNERRKKDGKGTEKDRKKDRKEKKSKRRESSSSDSNSSASSGLIGGYRKGETNKKAPSDSSSASEDDRRKKKKK